tara:strand:+ start:772 stop:1098 length:327 start_codon:yes stop_codon:yes gene_type:complete
MDLTDGLKQIVQDKVAKLLRHEPRIDRVRVELEHHETKSHHGQFTAKGHVEIAGPDLNASATEDDAYAAIDKLVSELDRALRKRAADRLSKRHDLHPVDLGADLPKVD